MLLVFSPGVSLLDLRPQGGLHRVPSFTVDQRLKGPLDLQLAAFLDAQVALVPEHGDVAASDRKDVRCLQNLLVGRAVRPHLEGLPYPRSQVRVRNPPADDVRLSVALGAN
jgi:hypothetical protein